MWERRFHRGMYACVLPSHHPALRVLAATTPRCIFAPTLAGASSASRCAEERPALPLVHAPQRARSVGADSARCHVSRQRAFSTIDLVRPLRWDVQALNIPVARFLNRILGLRLELQNEVFSYFSQAFHSACGEGTLSAAFSLWFAGVTR